MQWTSSCSDRGPQRIGNRRRVSVPGRLTWRDSSGTLRFVSVTTRDISELDAFVECDRPASIPLYRLVHFQVEAPARGGKEIPESLQRGKVLSAVYRVGEMSPVIKLFVRHLRSSNFGARLKKMGNSRPE